MISLAIALIAGLVLYFRYTGDRNSAVALLAGCALVAFVLVIAAIRLAITHRRSHRLALENNVPLPRVHRIMELRQWLILTLGIAFFALGTGALTALRVVADNGNAPTPAPVAQPVTIATTDPVTEPPSAADSPAGSPADSSAGSAIGDPSPADAPSDDSTDIADPTDSPAYTPATQYLDSAQPLDGSYDANAVTFSAQRYPRGLSFWCATDTDSHLQWNVAGYAHFSTTAGIDDQTEEAFGMVADLLFYDQDGHQLTPKPVEVSVGHPKKVSIALTGVVSLRMTCSGRIAKSNQEHSIHTSFGDAVVTR